MAEAARHPETRDVWPRALLLFGGGLLVFLALSVIVLRLIFGTASYWPRASEDNAAAPQLRTHPQADLAAFRSAEEEQLHKLGWVDRKKGIARIPIEDAMRLVASHGLPDWAEGAQPR